LPAGSSKDLKGLLAANCNVQVPKRGLTITNVYGTDLSMDKSFYAIVTAAEHVFKILVWLEGLCTRKPDIRDEGQDFGESKKINK